MEIIKMFRKLLGLEFPVWCYGLECEICCKSFLSAKGHWDYVTREGTFREHYGKVPVLRKEV